MTIKRHKKQKLRNAEYYDLQPILDKLYSDSKKGKIFNDLMSIIRSEQNIRLAYRNLKKNEGSKTAGVDKKNIVFLKSWKSDDLVKYVQKRLRWYRPQAAVSRARSCGIWWFLSVLPSYRNTDCPHPRPRTAWWWR